MSSKSSRQRLPFEPRQSKKKPAEKADAKSPRVSQSTRDNNSPDLKAIPEVVSKRMVRRMAIFCGIPTALGMTSFFIAYWLVSHVAIDIPTRYVAAISMGLFGLGVVGLSYGIFSTSWDEERVGGWFGWQEFRTNFGRTTQAWRTASKEAKGN